MKARNAIASALFVSGLVLNPAYFLGCAAEEKERKFDYGEAEMLSLLDDINDTDAWLIVSDGVEYTVQVSLSQARGADDTKSAAPSDRESGESAWTQQAHACGNKERVFGSTASACDTLYITTIPVEGTLEIFKIEGSESSLVKELAVSGDLQVMNPTFAHGEVFLYLEDERATLSLQGKTLSGFYDGMFSAEGLGDGGLDIAGDVEF